MNEEIVKYRSCGLCEASCGLAVTLRGNEILRIVGDPEDPHSRGALCPKARAAKELYEDPDRLRTPVKRTKNGFVRISWDEAFRICSTEIGRIRKAHGKDATAIYIGNPVAFDHALVLSLIPLFAALGTRNRFSSTSVDQLPVMVASYLMFGHQVMVPVPDIDRTSFFLVLGSNPLVSQGSILSAPGMARRISALKKRGGRLVVVDPRRTETAKAADTHLFIRPGADALFLLSLLNVIFSENLARPGRLAPHFSGMADLARLASGFSPETVSERTGIAPEAVRSLARDFARADRAVCYSRMGLCGQETGVVATWLTYCLSAVTGNLDSPGGACFARPAADIAAVTALLNEKGHLGMWKSRVSGMPEFAGELPAACLAEEILTPGKEKIRGLVAFAANPALALPDCGLTERALCDLDFYAAVDFAINESTRHAHVILPSRTLFEQSQYTLLPLLLAVRPTAKYSPPALAPDPGLRDGWEIALGLAKGLARDPVSRAALRLFSPERVLSLLLRFGPYGAGMVPGKKGLTLKELARHPHGIALGEPVPSLPGRLYTPERKVQLAPEELMASAAGLARGIEEKDGPDGALALVGRRLFHSMNSSLRNLPSFAAREEFTAWINPTDAAARGIADGAPVTLSSEKGSIPATARVTEDIMPGVVSIPHALSRPREGVRMSEAVKHPAACMNELTDHRRVDTVCAMAALNGRPVQVAAAVQTPGAPDRVKRRKSPKS
ncbi:MAG: molybdopterin-dependent oxidoreductase [Thermodesulfobacteriota bacterium]